MRNEKKVLAVCVSMIVITITICGGFICKYIKKYDKIQSVGTKEKSIVEDENQKEIQEEINGSSVMKEEEKEQEESIESNEVSAETEENLNVLANPEMYTYQAFEEDSKLLADLYPDKITVDSLGMTEDGRQMIHFVIGDASASKKIFIGAGIHAREYITSQLVMKQTVEFLEHLENEDSYHGITYADLLNNTVIHVICMINPDGISISQLGINGILTEKVKENLEQIAKLDGENLNSEYLVNWKANANGVDLNRNFDAMWDIYQDPAGHPSADHYKGKFPGCEIESKALIDLTRQEKFIRTINYHAQGEVIYWYFGQDGELYDTTKQFAEKRSSLTGYMLAADYEKLDPAGYKDWALQSEKIPSITIEVGAGECPVPAQQFETIWSQNEFVWEETLLNIKE